MAKISAGILLYRRRSRGMEFLVVHPGGPLWVNKDDGVWGIPKGEVHEGEDLLVAARRETAEELGFAPAGPFLALEPVTLKSGKIVYAWACEGEFDPGALRSNTFRLEWPPHSGKFIDCPEVDRARWVTLEEAQILVSAGQWAILVQVAARFCE